MLYTIKNEFLTVKISDAGAELFSAVGTDGYEYIWQGDNRFWGGRAPVLFPICGRLFGGKYYYKGKEYEMGSHGFAKKMDFEVAAKTEDSVTMTLRSSEATREIFPFDFTFSLTYSLRANGLYVNANIKNDGGDVMPATFGAHPGFNVPLCEGADFSEHYFEFSEECHPNQLTICEDGMFSGITTAMPLENDRILRLDREMFVIDGIFMNRMASEVTLKTDKTDRAVTMKYEGFPYLGIWQAYGDTPFICVEPWCGLPDYEGLTRDITEKNDMFHLAPHGEKTISYSIIFK